VQDGELEAPVSDNSRALAATIAGAMIGGVAGFFFFTERGRALRRQLEPVLDDFARELNSFRLTVEKSAGLANEGWKLLNEAMESGSHSSKYPPTPQTHPF
jgi:hypothetical protein